MSASAVSLSTSFRPADTTTPAFTWGRYARAGLLTIGVSVLANAVFFYLVQVAVQYDPAFLPLGNVSAPIIFTVFPAVGAALLYAGLLQFVRNATNRVDGWCSALSIPSLPRATRHGRVVSLVRHGWSTTISSLVGARPSGWARV